MEFTFDNIKNIPRSCKTWEFDVTSFRPDNKDTSEKFEKMLEENNLSVHQRLTTKHPSSPSSHFSYLWKTPDNSIQLLTTHNPLTGEDSRGKIQKSSMPDMTFGKKVVKGYQSENWFLGRGGYMAIQANSSDALSKAVASIHKHAVSVKEESGCTQGTFVSFPSQNSILKIENI